jgi:hypothetical protein
MNKNFEDVSGEKRTCLTLLFCNALARRVNIRSFIGNHVQSSSVKALTSFWKEAKVLNDKFQGF